MDIADLDKDKVCLAYFRKAGYMMRIADLTLEEKFGCAVDVDAAYFEAREIGRRGLDICHGKSLVCLNDVLEVREFL